MSTSIDQAFIEQFESEVKAAYQRKGSMLRNTVRVKTGVIGEATTFQTVGKTAATGKARHAPIPPANQDHTPVLCPITDEYIGDYVDQLDQLKTNSDERMNIANANVWALGRAHDAKIVTALELGTLVAGSGVDGLTLAKAKEASRILDENDVPRDGERFAIVSPGAWEDLLDIEEFSSADYVRAENLPYVEDGAKKWNGAMWMQFTGLGITANVRRCFMYHRSSTGFAVQQEIDLDVDWEGSRRGHFVSSATATGSCLIDNRGVVEMPVLEG